MAQLGVVKSGGRIYKGGWLITTRAHSNHTAVVEIGCERRRAQRSWWKIRRSAVLHHLITSYGQVDDTRSTTVRMTRNDASHSHVCTVRHAVSSLGNGQAEPCDEDLSIVFPHLTSSVASRAARYLKDWLTMPLPPCHLPLVPPGNATVCGLATVTVAKLFSRSASSSNLPSCSRVRGRTPSQAAQNRRRVSRTTNRYPNASAASTYPPYPRKNSSHRSLSPMLVGSASSQAIVRRMLAAATRYRCVARPSNLDLHVDTSHDSQPCCRLPTAAPSKQGLNDRAS